MNRHHQNSLPTRVAAQGCANLVGLERHGTPAGCLKRILRKAAHMDDAVFDATPEKTKIVNRVRRLRGQIQAIERALDHEGGRSDVLRLVVRARGTINRLMADVLENCIRMQVAAPARMPDAEFARANERLIDVVHSYLK